MEVLQSSMTYHSLGAPNITLAAPRLLPAQEQRFPVQHIRRPRSCTTSSVCSQPESEG